MLDDVGAEQEPTDRDEPSKVSARNNEYPLRGSGDDVVEPLTHRRRRKYVCAERARPSSPAAIICVFAPPVAFAFALIFWNSLLRRFAGRRWMLTTASRPTLRLAVRLVAF